MSMRSNIEPVKWKLNATENITQLRVIITFDNLHTHADLQWQVMADDLIVQDAGYISILGGDYIGWTGDNNYPITYAANALGLTIIS